MWRIYVEKGIVMYWNIIDFFYVLSTVTRAVVGRRKILGNMVPIHPCFEWVGRSMGTRICCEGYRASVWMVLQDSWESVTCSVGRSKTYSPKELSEGNSMGQSSWKISPRGRAVWPILPWPCIQSRYPCKFVGAYKMPHYLIEQFCILTPILIPCLFFPKGKFLSISVNQVLTFSKVDHLVYVLSPFFY